MEPPSENLAIPNSELTEGGDEHVRINYRDQAAGTEHIKWAVANGYLEIDEAEERLEVIYQATTRGELRPAVFDLPAHQPPPPVSAAAAQPQTSIRNVFGETTKSMDDLSEPVAIKNVFGEVRLDLSTAAISANGARISVSSLFGTVKIIVPDGVRVNSEVTAILAEAKDKLVDMVPGAPVVHITGTVMLGEYRIYSVSRTPKKVLKSVLKRLTQG